MVTILFASCRLEHNCDEISKSVRETECLLIFEKLPAFTSPYLNAEGKHLYTKRECTCKDNGRWWSSYREFLEKGDTVIKQKGELIFSIHKKDTILNFNWECDGKKYE